MNVHAVKHTKLCVALVAGLMLPAGAALADIPGRATPAGTAGTGTSGANPGTQQQELPNITFPAPYNVFEFTVTCMACHGGVVDQTASHSGNWAGSAMASSARDPVFRANQLLVNNTIKALGAGDGAGNVCMRCHSPNGWYSGRFDPKLGGAGDGSNMMDSIVLSTDGEGISCEFCHRAIGAVTKGRMTVPSATVFPYSLEPVPATSTAFNMLAGISDWPHAGAAYTEGPGDGNPFGDATLQLHDGMGYGGKYSGSFFPFFADAPITGEYTGQTYGVFPPGWGGPGQTPGTPVINPDGSYSIQFDVPVGVPCQPGLQSCLPNYQAQSLSIEHPTRDGTFLRSSEFCGACHDLTVPVLNHGMPEQRTYTEWKYSDFGPAGVGGDGSVAARCQDCHMPTMKHEFTDVAKLSLNSDPTVSGWWPYSKDRNPDGGTTFHKLAGANRDLPAMMKVAYPEVDLEVVGAPTGHDPSIFPGMFSDRGPMWDRAQRNTEISMREAASITVSQAPVCDGTSCTVKVKVTNNSGHRIPTGYPDGRRLWIGVVASDATGVVYESGVYDAASATLSTDRATSGVKLALTPTIDARVENAVMVYERGTCMTPLSLPSNAPGVVCDANGITPSLINKSIAFDNRIPPKGFDPVAYSQNGAKFYTYTTNATGNLVPQEDLNRYPATQNWDEVTYTFPYTGTGTPTVRATLYWQTHTREFMEYLKDGVAGLADRGPRPTAPPSPLDPNYPMTPTYIADTINLASMTDLAGQPLNDDWGGVAYATWLMTGKGEPFALGAADTSVTAPPAATTVVVHDVLDPQTGGVDANAQDIIWTAVDGADGYLVWVRSGTDTDPSDVGVTASWDKLAVVPAGTVNIVHEGLNPGKTFQYRVQAFNAAGYGPMSPVVAAKTADGLLLGVINTKVTETTATTVSLTFFDQDFNEVGFAIDRQDVLANGGLGAWTTIAYMGTPNMAGYVSVTFTDGVALPTCPADVVHNPPSQAGCYVTGYVPLVSGRTYNYRVSSYNGFQVSPPDLAVAATLLAAPIPPSNLVASLAGGVTLTWTDNSINEASFRIDRAANGGAFATLATVAANTVSYVDATVADGTTYSYQVVAVNVVGTSAPSNTASITTPPPVAAPTALTATPSAAGVAVPTVTLRWTDNQNVAPQETGFQIERDGVLIASLATNTLSFVDTTVAPKTTYVYQVRAYRTTGGTTQVSAYSNTATAVTPGQAPQPPTTLRAVGSTRTSITLTWVDQSTNETSFSLERSLNSRTLRWSVVAGNIAANTTRYTDTRGLSRNTGYVYRIRACNADGCSAYSANATAKTAK